MPSFAFLLRSAATLLLASTMAICAVQAAEPDYESLARQEIAQYKYTEAAATLRLAIYKGSKSPSIWLLLGESYVKLGEMGAARQSYQSVVRYFPGTRECQIAQRQLSVLPAPTGKGTSGATAGHIASGHHLIDRIELVRPRFGHLPVDVSTATLVRSIVGHLPLPIYKILDQGKTKIFVTPNLIDVFPDAVKFRFPGIGCYLSSQYGRTYGRDIYICERHTVPEGSTNLSPIHDVIALKCTTFTQLAHALDDCLEVPSKDEQYLQLYRQDAAAADVRKYPEMKPYALEDANGASETFGGLAASLMGDDSNLAAQLSHTFPRSRAWIERRVQMLSADSSK